MSTLEEGHFAPHISFKVNGNNQVKLKLSKVSLLFRKEPAKPCSSDIHSPFMLQPPQHHYFHTYSFIQQSCLLPLKIIGKHAFCIITPQNLIQNDHFHERATLRQLKLSPLIPIKFFFSDNLFYIKQVDENSFIFFFAYRKKFLVLLKNKLLGRCMVAVAISSLEV